MARIQSFRPTNLVSESLTPALNTLELLLKPVVAVRACGTWFLRETVGAGSLAVGVRLYRVAVVLVLTSTWLVRFPHAPACHRTVSRLPAPRKRFERVGKAAEVTRKTFTKAVLC